jgi:hypothetical protein
MGQGTRLSRLPERRVDYPTYLTLLKLPGEPNACDQGPMLCDRESRYD